jgi:hypothetical protein
MPTKFDEPLPPATIPYDEYKVDWVKNALEPVNNQCFPPNNTTISKRLTNENKRLLTVPWKDLEELLDDDIYPNKDFLSACDGDEVWITHKPNNEFRVVIDKGTRCYVVKTSWLQNPYMQKKESHLCGVTIST